MNASRLRFVLLGGLCWVALAAPASAAPVVDLSVAGQDAVNPQIAFDKDGNALAVWSRSNGTNTIIQSAFRPAGGTFAAPVDLTAGRDGSRPQVAFDKDGNALAVWERFNGLNTVIQASFRPAGGAFQADPDTISDINPVANRDAVNPEVTFDKDGKALAVWSRRADGLTRVIEASSRTPGTGGAFQAVPDTLSVSGLSADVPQVAFDKDGNALVVWQRSNGSTIVIQASARPAAGAFQATPDNLSAATGANAGNPQVAFDKDANALVIWARQNDVQTSNRPAGGAFQAVPDNITGVIVGSPQVAFDKEGNALIVWRDGAVNGIIRSSFRPFAGAFAPPVDLSAPGQEAVTPQVAFDNGGNALAVWTRSNGSKNVVQASRRPAGGAFGAPVDLSDSSQAANRPQVAFDKDGNALAAWHRSDGANTIIQATFGALAPANPGGGGAGAGGAPAAPAGAGGAPAGGGSAGGTGTTPPGKFTVDVQAKHNADGSVELITNAPAAGVVTASDTKRAKQYASISKKLRRKALFFSTRVTAKKAGRVRLKLRPTSAAKNAFTALRRIGFRPQLPVKVKITFKPAAGGKTVVRTKNVALKRK